MIPKFLSSCPDLSSEFWTPRFDFFLDITNSYIQRKHFFFKNLVPHVLILVCSYNHVCTILPLSRVVLATLVFNSYAYAYITHTAQNSRLNLILHLTMSFILDITSLRRIFLTTPYKISVPPHHYFLFSALYLFFP